MSRNPTAPPARFPILGKHSPPFFQSLEKSASSFSKPWGTGRMSRRAKRGSALIVALWVLLILSLLVAGFAFDMYIEAGITSFYRKRLRAQYLAQAGMEYAKLVLAQSFRAREEIKDENMGEEEYIRALNLARGLAVSGLSRDLGEGRFTLEIVPEQGRRNVNTISDEDWEEILDQAGVPQEKWDELIACFRDWIDQDDEHRLNGAESDDPFYKRRNYKCKNAAVDTVDELLLIKGFSPSLLYGGPSEYVEGETLVGIAGWLTVWGDGKVNVNTASREVLLTIPGLDEYDVTDILQGRLGFDGQPGTKDDGFKTMEEVMALLGTSDERVRNALTVSERRYVRVISIGESYGVRSGIWAVLQVDETGVTPVFWREEAMP